VLVCCRVWRNKKRINNIQACYPRRCLLRKVRLTSQRRALSPAELFSAALTAADDDDFLDFSHDDIFSHQHFRSLIYDDDDRALHYLSADPTMTSPLLCDRAYLSVTWVEWLRDLFLPVVQSQAI